jgi:hypothetical protein
LWIVIGILGCEISLKLFNRRSKAQSESERVNNSEQDDILKRLCGNDREMYEALSNFLFLDPRGYEKSVGTEPQLMKQGMEALENGNRLHARVSFEGAARLALFYQDREGVENSLGLAEEAAEEKSEARHRMHETLLTNLSRAFDIAREYYKYKYGYREREKIELEAPELTPMSISISK